MRVNNGCVHAVFLETTNYRVLLAGVRSLGVEYSISITRERYRAASLAPLVRRI